MLDVENLVSRASYAQANSPAQISLIAQLNGVELYADCSRSSSGKLQLATASAGSLTKVLRLFTSRQHSGIKQPYAALKWEDALTMITSSPDLDGVQIINMRNDWVAYGKAVLQQARPHLSNV